MSVGVFVGGGVPVGVSDGVGVFVGVSVGGGSVGTGDKVGVSVKSSTDVGEGTTATSVASGVGVLEGATVGVTCGILVPQAPAITARTTNQTIRRKFTDLLQPLMVNNQLYYNHHRPIRASRKGHDCPTLESFTENQRKSQILLIQNRGNQEQSQSLLPII